MMAPSVLARAVGDRRTFMAGSFFLALNNRVPSILAMRDYRSGEGY
jgi:hypothetical protein